MVTPGKTGLCILASAEIFAPHTSDPRCVVWEERTAVIYICLAVYGRKRSVEFEPD